MRTRSHRTATSAASTETALGRLERVVLALAVAAIALVLVAPSLADGAQPVPDTILVRVEKGDSVWSIAHSISGDRDPGAIVRTIRELNGLEDATLAEGSLIRVPTLPGFVALTSR